MRNIYIINKKLLKEKWKIGGDGVSASIARSSGASCTTSLSVSDDLSQVGIDLLWVTFCIDPAILYRHSKAEPIRWTQRRR